MQDKDYVLSELRASYGELLLFLEQNLDGFQSPYLCDRNAMLQHVYLLN